MKHWQKLAMLVIAFAILFGNVQTGIARELARITLLDSLEMSGASCLEVKVVENFAYTTGVGSCLRIIDVSDPTNIVLVGSYDRSETPFTMGIAVANGYAYIAAQYEGLVVIDVAIPAAPQYVRTVLLPGATTAFAVSGNRLFTAQWNAPNVILDITDPSNPIAIGTCPYGWSYEVASAGSNLLVANDYSLDICDVSNPQLAVPLGQFSTEYGTRALECRDNLLYMVNLTSGLHILDISNPNYPIQLSNVDGNETPTDIALSNDYACVTDLTQGLFVYSVTDASNPQLAGQVPIFDLPYGVFVVGEILYVACQTGGLQIYSVVSAFCGDTDGSNSVTISDAVYLINYIFSGGPAPNPLLAGDVDCSDAVTISDAVYLINYIFSSGSVPCAACP